MSQRLLCPHCRGALTLVPADNVFVCSTCEGQFCSSVTLKKLVAEAKGLGLGAFERPRLSLQEPVKYVPCPDCGDRMHRRNFASSSGIIVDICPVHGIWFDSGELTQILRFCSAGGLAQAHRAGIERREGINRVDAFAKRLKDGSPRQYYWAGQCLIDIEKMGVFIDEMAEWYSADD